MRANEQRLKERCISQIHLCQRVLKTPLKSREQLLSLSVSQLEELAAKLDEQVLAPEGETVE